MVLVEAVVLLLTAVAVFAAYEQHSLWRKRKNLPGPSVTPPFFGTIFHMIKRPFEYYDIQEKYGPLSWNCLIGKFVVFSADLEATRKVFANTADSFRLMLTLGARRILGDNNIAFMNGPPHKALRKRLLPLFTRKALRVYLAIQEREIREHIDQWLKMPQPIQVRLLARDLNIVTSTSVFVGPYMTPERRDVFAKLYNVMNDGMLAFPLNFPGTTLWHAIRAREKIMTMLVDCVQRSRERMAGGEEAKCLLDVWMEAVENDKSKGEEVADPAAGEQDESDNTKPAEFDETDYDIALHVLDFLFASQDASTSSIVWACTLLEEHPDVLAKLREEQARMRPNDAPFDPEECDKMTYTRQVVKEILRFRPPATMVPHIAVKECAISSDYTVPEGSIVLPSIWASHFQNFTDAHKFDPDRFSAERREDVTYAKNFLAFGAGPHMCLGREYAMNHIMAFAGLWAMKVDSKRIRTPGCDDIVFLPTIYPADDCRIAITARA